MDENQDNKEISLRCKPLDPKDPTMLSLSDNPEVRFSGKGSGFGSIPKYNPTCSLNARDSKAVF